MSNMESSFLVYTFGNDLASAMTVRPAENKMSLQILYIYLSMSTYSHSLYCAPKPWVATHSWRCRMDDDGPAMGKFRAPILKCFVILRRADSVQRGQGPWLLF